MSGRIQRWGNSLAIRIPKGLAAELGLGPGTQVEISGTNGKMLVAPSAPVYTLSQLVSQINPKNLHRETDTGTPRGREIW